MLKLTKTGIGLLTKQYRSVLKKCLLLNLGCLLYVNLACEKSYAVSAMSTYCLYNYGLFGCLASVDGDNVRGEYIYNGEPHYLELKDFGLKIVQGDSDKLLTSAYDDLRPDSSDTERVLGFSVYNIFALDEKLFNLNNQLLNYYYTFRVDESAEVIEFAGELNDDILSFKMKELKFQNPTRLGAFIKCDEACPRLSERFSLSLSQEQMFKNDASVDAGTSRHCLRKFGDVLANLLKNMASKYAKMNDFMNVEVCHA